MCYFLHKFNNEKKLIIFFTTHQSMQPEDELAAR